MTENSKKKRLCVMMAEVLGWLECGEAFAGLGCEQGGLVLERVSQVPMQKTTK